jgi:alpha-galactosidase
MRLALLLLSCCALGALALDNGQGLRPAMGFNTWNTFATNIDEELIKDTTDLMIRLGLKDAGYEYVNLDDAWSAPARQDGRLVADPLRFPSGIRALSDYVHSKDLKFGIYGDAGALTCAGYPGSRGFEKVDAQTWADWGVDYLKYDNCWAPASDWVIDRYVAMRDALNATGRPLLYSLCEWGVADPWTWAAAVGNSWRATEVQGPRALQLMPARCAPHQAAHPLHTGMAAAPCTHPTPTCPPQLPTPKCPPCPSKACVSLVALPNPSCLPSPPAGH